MKKTLVLLCIALSIMMLSCKPEKEKKQAVVSTNSVISITTNTAVCGGNVTADGGAEVTSRGICWSTLEMPTLINGMSAGCGNGLGQFETKIEGLMPDTKYNVRAYATNSEGTSYGDVESFTTMEEIIEIEELPSVTTAFIIDIKSKSAKCGGCVTSDGGLNVISRGICWSTSQYPTKEDDYESAGSGIGEYKCELGDLKPNTTYYVRAYATNAKGTSYGEEKSFTTLEPENIINGHEYVDLGLPSGLKWATCNVGAIKPEFYGDYYAWGMLEPYGEVNCTTGNLDEDISGNPNYDVARSKWGGTWRIPTKKEMDELKGYCEWVKTTINNINGYKVIGLNGNSIFLPAAGTTRDCYDYYGSKGNLLHYWLSTPYKGEVLVDFDEWGDPITTEANFSYTLLQKFNEDYVLYEDYDGSNTSRYCGLSIRPVTD